MTPVVVNQIEMQFVHLSAAEQRVRHERPVPQSRSGGVNLGGLRELPFETPSASPVHQLELDRTEEFRAAESDLLSEID